MLALSCHHLNIFGRGSYYFSKLKGNQIQASPKENGTMFDTQKYVQSLDDPPQILKMYSEIQQIHNIVHNRICCIIGSILFVIKLMNICVNVSFCVQCQLSCILAPLQPKKFSTYTPEGYDPLTSNYKLPGLRVDHHRDY